MILGSAVRFAGGMMEVPSSKTPKSTTGPDNRVDGIFELVLQFCMIGHARFCLKGLRRPRRSGISPRL